MRASCAQQLLISYPPTSNQVVEVTFTDISSSFGPTVNSYTVQLSTPTPGATIFYTIDPTGGVDPTHVGDSATGVTIRIGSNTGVIVVSCHTNVTKTVRALAYKNGLSDSIINDASYDGPQT